MKGQAALFQTTLRSTDAVVAETHEALAAVEASASVDWKAHALEVIRRVCVENREWFADDLWAAGLRATAEDRALGPVVMRAARLGWCERTDRTRPSRRSHMTGKPVWRSLIYGTRSAA